MSLKRLITTVISTFLLAIVLLAGNALSVQAAPAAPRDIPITQPDGTKLVVRLWGDEWNHGMETLDGYTVVKNADGYWVYATVQTGGALAPALQDGRSMVAGKDAPVGLAQHIRPTNVQSPVRNTAARGHNIGTQPILLVLVDYSNTPHIYAPSVFQTSFFGATNSIVDYYKTASFNNLNLSKVTESYGTANDGVVGWLRLAGTFSLSLDTRQIAHDALVAADPYVNFAAYDADGNGYITSTELHLVIVTSGYEQSYCGPSCMGIWAHQWSVSGLMLDGKYVATDSADGKYGGYSMFGEIHGDGSGNALYQHPATIGVMVHELGHDLSWPDLYDTKQYPTWGGPGEWTIMAGGSWNYVSGVTDYGGTPALPDAWLKAYQGWITPTVASNGSTYSLPTSATNATALQIGTNTNGIDWDFTNHSGTGEYWIAENRQLTGYDAGLPGCGILIYHVDETVSSWNDANNNRDKPLMAVEEADGYADLYNNTWYADAGDAFPGTSGKYSFGNGTNPNSKFHSGISSNNTVSIISTSCSSSMSVQYSGQGPVLNNSWQYLPIIHKPMLYATGKITYRNAPAAGVTISMDITNNDWNNWNTIYTTTDANGNYNFGANTPQVTGSVIEYQVYYNNLEQNTSRLTYWNCYVRYDGGGSDTCNIDIGDVTHRTPAAGATLKLPGYIGWNTRPIGTDSYDVTLYDDYDYLACWTNRLGYTNQFLMTSLSANLNCLRTMYTGQRYWRTIYVYGPNGYGMGMWWWATYFNGPAGPALPGEMRSSLDNPNLSREEMMKKNPALRFGPVTGGDFAK